MKLVSAVIGSLILTASVARSADVHSPQEIPTITVSPGVLLKELTGLSSLADAKTKRCSVAFFHMEPGHGSAWSFNKFAEESFFVLKGHGVVWTGNRPQAVTQGSFILVPANVVRSIRANNDEVLEFYAITSPSWTKEDDILTTAPLGAPK